MLLFIFSFILSVIFPGSRIAQIRTLPGDTILVVTSENGAWKGTSPESLFLIEGTENFFLTDGIKFEDCYIFSTCGSGLVLIGRDWSDRWGFSKMGPNRQYCSTLEPYLDKLIVGFSDGLCEARSSGIKPLDFFQQGKLSYTIDIAVNGETLATSNLSGVFFSSKVEIEDLFFPDSLSHNKTLFFLSESLLVGTDSGIWLFDGFSWHFIENTSFVYCFFSDLDFIWVGTFEGIEIFDKKSLRKLFKYGNCPVYSICKFKGKWLFGTAIGMFSDSLPCLPDAKNDIVNSFREYPHPFILSPFPVGFNTSPDQTYLFASTFGGKLRIHKGIDFNNPAYTPIIAGFDGEVVSAGTSSTGANYITVKYFNHTDEFGAIFLHAHLAEQSGLRQGDIFHAQDTLGFVGRTGRATNDHLHLETRILVNGSYFSVNPLIWFKPLDGTGAVAGIITQNGLLLEEAKIYGILKPDNIETPFIYAQTYPKGVCSDPELGENFFIDGVLPGFYELEIEKNGKELQTLTIEVRQGLISWLQIDVSR